MDVQQGCKDFFTLLGYWKVQVPVVMSQSAVFIEKDNLEIHLQSTCSCRRSLNVS